MPGVSVRIYGEGDAARVGAALIRAGDGHLKRKLYDAIRQANVGIESELRASAITHLPKRHGLGREVARARISTRRFSGGDAVGITITAHHQYDIEGMDAGTVIAPSWGHRPWHAQGVPPGWFSNVVEHRGARIRAFIDKACDEVAAEI